MIPMKIARDRLIEPNDEAMGKTFNVSSIPLRKHHLKINDIRYKNKFVNQTQHRRTVTSC